MAGVAPWSAVRSAGGAAIELSRQVGEADRRWSLRSGDHIAAVRLPASQIAQLLADHERSGEPLPLLPDHNIRDGQNYRAQQLAAGRMPRTVGEILAAAAAFA